MTAATSAGFTVPWSLRGEQDARARLQLLGFLLPLHAPQKRRIARQRRVEIAVVRLGRALQNRVRYDVDPQVLGVQVPVLTIQPLIENAVKHGLADKVGGGTVTLKARVDPLARTTTIQVRDDGIGMDAARLEEVLTGSGSDGGIGLRNITERLTTLFGERFRLDVRSKPGEGTTVDLRVPLR